MSRASLRRLHRDQRGAGLVETLVATTLLGLALVVLMGSFSTFAVASRRAERTATAQTAIRAQAARLKAAPYQASGNYAAWFEPLAAGLSRTVTVTWWNGTNGWVGTQNANGLQKIALSIEVDGSTASSLEIVKADR